MLAFWEYYWGPGSSVGNPAPGGNPPGGVPSVSGVSIQHADGTASYLPGFFAATVNKQPDGWRVSLIPVDPTTGLNSMVAVLQDGDQVQNIALPNPAAFADSSQVTNIPPQVGAVLTIP